MTGKHPGHAWIRDEAGGQEPVGEGELLLPGV